MSDVFLIAIVAPPPTTTFTPVPDKVTTAPADATANSCRSFVRYKPEDMIDIFGVVGVGLGVLWDCMGRIGVGGGEGGRYSLRAPNIYNVKDTT